MWWTASWDVLRELAPWLLLGAAISGALHAFLPPGLIRQQLRGPSGVIKAVVLGVPLPLCSCGVIPAGVGLKRDGASDGSAVAFLIATPQTGIDSVLVSASFLGWPFALFKVGAAFATGIAGGLLVDRIGDGGSASTVDHPTEAPQGPAWRRGLDHADDVIGSIWGWLVFGIAVSAALQVFLPADALGDTLVATGIVGGLIALVVSLPLYVCATASVPIAAGLLHAGMSPGAALVFLMAGPATNVATIGAVHKAFGTRVLSAYLGTVIVGSLRLGLLFDGVLAGEAILPDAHAHAGPIATVSALVLLGLFLRYAVLDLRAWLAPTADQPNLELQVAGMTCGGCARKVDSAVRALDGVDAVEVVLDRGLVRIQGRVPLDQVMDAVRAAGFDPSKGSPSVAPASS